jgi:hypothetical protein
MKPLPGVPACTTAPRFIEVAMLEAAIPAVPVAIKIEAAVGTFAGGTPRQAGGRLERERNREHKPDVFLQPIQ